MKRNRRLGYRSNSNELRSRRFLRFLLRLKTRRSNAFSLGDVFHPNARPPLRLVCARDFAGPQQDKVPVTANDSRSRAAKSYFDQTDARYIGAVFVYRLFSRILQPKALTIPKSACIMACQLPSSFFSGPQTSWPLREVNPKPGTELPLSLTCSENSVSVARILIGS